MLQLLYSDPLIVVGMHGNELTEIRNAGISSVNCRENFSVVDMIVGRQGDQMEFVERFVCFFSYVLCVCVCVGGGGGGGAVIYHV